MNLPNRSYGFGSYNRNKFRKGIALAVLAVAIIIIGVVVILTVSSKSGKENTLSLSQLFDEYRFRELSDQAESVLADKPFDYEALVYNGLAWFYLGDGEYSLETRYPYFEKAIINLRRAELVGTAYDGLIKYKLGQAYFSLGREYHDLALRYLDSSLKAGYQGKEINEILGMVYNTFGFYNKALTFFYKALDQKAYDQLYNVIAKTHLKNGNYEKAREFYKHVIESTSNEILKLDTYLQLVLVDIDEKKYDQALEQLNAILAEKPDSADAYFYRGNVYSGLAEANPDEANKYNIMARAEWRKAISIDPLHTGANQKLNR